MKRVWSRFASGKRERGAVMLLVAGTTLLLLLLGAVAVDLSITGMRGQQLQNAADAAALAGVQAYRNGDGDETAATAAVMDLLEQNGVDLGEVGLAVEFPDPTNETEVRVVISDANSGALLTGVTGSDGAVSRNATARFEKCDDGCNVIVPIRAPFQTLSATGTGDGFIPIPVGDDELYALNHNSSAGAIVCIDRTTANDVSLPSADRGRCAGWAGTSRPAYATSQRGPEMPHTAVYGTRIFWTVSDALSTKLVCFETGTATPGPCSSAIQLNTRARATSGQISNTKDQDRGGGTVLVNDRIYVFTDDHRVHCIDPVTMSVCALYAVGGNSNALRLANFPTNEPTNANHGASIDRIVDESTGRMYSTIHIVNAVPTVSCSANMSVPSGRVVIKNVATNQYLGVNSGTSSLEHRTDYNNTRSQWDVADRGGGFYAFRSANSSSTAVLDADGNNVAAGISTSIATDDEWSIVASGASSKIRNRVTANGDLRQVTTSFTTNTSATATGTNWVIRPWQCEQPGYVPPPTPTLPYAAGTWLHCWDTATDMPCSGFTPSRIHTDGSRFSGRLFFYRQPTTGDELGVCSTGYNGTVQTSNLQISCVTLATGLANPSYVTAMASFRTAVAANTNNSPAAWGIPEWNEDANRLFYPTEHGNSRVVCWDFDTSSTCGSRRAQTALGYIEDYGFYSEGNCMYGLGHNARFYAFDAEDIFAECAPYAPDTVIRPCECSGTYAWGTLTFDLDLALFSSFLVEIFDQNGNRVWPANPSSPPHSLHTNGITIDLNNVPIDNPWADTLTIEVEIEAADGVDLSTLGPQTFAVSFARAPRLVE